MPPPNYRLPTGWAKAKWVFFLEKKPAPRQVRAAALQTMYRRKRDAQDQPHRPEGRRSRNGDEILRERLRLSAGQDRALARPCLAPPDRRLYRPRADGL